MDNHFDWAFTKANHNENWLVESDYPVDDLHLCFILLYYVSCMYYYAVFDIYK